MFKSKDCLHGTIATVIGGVLYGFNVDLGVHMVQRH